MARAVMSRVLAVFAFCPGGFRAHAEGFDHAHGAWDALLKRHVVVLSGGEASQVRHADFRGVLLLRRLWPAKLSLFP